MQSTTPIRIHEVIDGSQPFHRDQEAICGKMGALLKSFGFPMHSCTLTQKPWSLQLSFQEGGKPKVFSRVTYRASETWEPVNYDGKPVLVHGVTTSLIGEGDQTRLELKNIEKIQDKQ